MDTMQQDVADFHKVVCNEEVPETIELRDTTLRADLIAEEITETLTAMTGRTYKVVATDEFDLEGPNLVDTIDGICDSIYVLLGAACTFGVDLEPFWIAIQNSNMAKADGPIREDGKRLKPEGWEPPNLELVLELVQEKYAIEKAAERLKKEYHERLRALDKQYKELVTDRLDEVGMGETCYCGETH